MPDVRFPMTIFVSPDAAGQRLDQFLTAQHSGHQPRARAAIAGAGEGAGQRVGIEAVPATCAAESRSPSSATRNLHPLRAIAEDIPLDIVYEDEDLAVVNKPAGMMVHAGAGATDYERNRGTLVNALLHRFGTLSELGGELRPGIVHRLDKETSGLIVVAKNDLAHRKLGQQFSSRQVKKRYVALVHGWPAKQRGTINSEISRDAVRRIRMTTRRSGGRAAVTHYEVRERMESPLRQIRAPGRPHRDGPHPSDSRAHGVHWASRGWAMSLYGAPKELRAIPAQTKGLAKRGSETQKSKGLAKEKERSALSLNRNFLHAAAIKFIHPRTGEPLTFDAPLPPELESFLLVIGREGAI